MNTRKQINPKNEKLSENWTKLPIRALGDILKGATAALASIIGLVFGGIFTNLIGLPAPVMPAQVNLNTILPLMFLSGILIAIVLGELFRKLDFKYWQRLLATWLCTYLVYFLLNTLDGMLYSPVINMSTGIVSNLFPSLFMSAVIAWLWRSTSAGPLTSSYVVKYLSNRKAGDWVWRVALAWMIYPPIYYLMGRVTGLFTQHFYEDPALNLGLTVPTLASMLAMQVLRGALFLLAVAPMLLCWRGSRMSLWLWLGAAIFIQIAAQPILQGYWYPIEMRIPHALELLVDSFAQTYVFTLLLFIPVSSRSGQEIKSSLPDQVTYMPGLN
jgi:hypothetical protein